MLFPTTTTLFITLITSVLSSPTIATSSPTSSPQHNSTKRNTIHLEPQQRHQLQKRDAYGSARATFFTPGLGACGTMSGDNDFIVALNMDQFQSPNGVTGPASSWCWKMLTISYGGKTTQAQVVDACPGCPYKGLDMSPGLFSFFANQDQGVITVDWTVGDDPSPATITTTRYVDPTSVSIDPPTTSTTITAGTWVWNVAANAWVDPATLITSTSSSSSSTADLTTSTTSSPSTSSASTTAASRSTTSAFLNATLTASIALNATSTTVVASAAASLNVTSPVTLAGIPTLDPSFRQGGNLDLINQLVLNMAGMVSAAAYSVAA